MSDILNDLKTSDTVKDELKIAMEKVLKMRTNDSEQVTSRLT